MSSELSDELVLQKQLPKRNRLLLVIQLSPMLTEEVGKGRKDELIEVLNRYFNEKMWNAEQGHRGVIGAKWTRPRQQYEQKYSDEGDF